MHATEIIAKASAYMRIWNAGWANQLDDLAHPDLIISYTHFPEPIQGIDAYKKALQQTYTYFPDIAIETSSIIAANDAATVEWRYSGTHQSGNLFGVNATGKKVTVAGITVLEFENGLVIKEHGIVDNLSLAMQLGIVNT